ncbi:hypothetical protein ACFWY6_19540 [Streptomyces sp. NPDC059037]|uniref:hypothetical protein n=1 Tax=Streptomyces sp. NPDC059037 TaxID=3346710 RepID=UPI0036B2440E
MSEDAPDVHDSYDEDAHDAYDEDTHDAYDEERELRVFLERAVPRPQAPASRLARVRERAARSRRRRIAAGAAVSVAGLALAGVLVPQALRPSADPEVVPPAATPPSRHASGERDVTYRELGGGLTLRFPADWQALAVPADDRTKSPPFGFAGTQRLTPYKQPCKPDEPGGWCNPLDRIDPEDGALLVLRTEKEGGLDKRAMNPPRFTSGTLRKSCALAGGGISFTAVLESPEPGRVIVANLCLAPGDSKPRLAEANRIIGSAHFGSEGSPPATAPAKN